MTTSANPKQATALTMETPLTPKQLLFVEHYVQHASNGTAAARAAGYKGNAATLAVVAHENLNKPYLRDEIVRRREEIREHLEISTQAKRLLLWEVANQCAIYGEVSRSEKVETMPDGTVVKTIHVLCSVFDSKAAIKAIVELNRMDGDYAVPGNRCFKF
jgi:phage terminase small subunit